jgi:disintegrin and metalloproteinase domain-containing protein 10
VHTPNGPITADTSHIYHGRVIGDPHSEVFGSIIDGVFEGKIITAKDSYFIEKARHYFKNVSHQLEHHDEPFHSVIYNEKHVDDPYQHKRTGHAGGCGINDDIAQWMDNIQNSAVDEEDNYLEDFKQNLLKKPSAQPKMKLLSENGTRSPNNNDIYGHYDFKHPYEKYSEQANYGYANSAPNVHQWHQESHERVRRAASKPKEENKNTCSLYIQTDPLIWRHIRDGIADVSDNYYCISLS